MTLKRAMLWSLLLLAQTASVASAHFLFLRITPPAEAGRAAEVYFSDLPEAGDTRFIDKIAHTKVWLQAEPGKLTPLLVHKGEDRLRAVVPAGGSIAVVGHCEYGVLPRKTPFLLRHFPKALDGTAAELNRMRPSDNVPLEIVAHFENSEVRLQALQGGKPLGGVEFFAVGKGLSNVKFRADGDGKATWRPPHRGRFAIYFGVFTKTPGQRGDKKYEEIRDFATLTFTWPLPPVGPDAKAVAMFQEAIAARAAWHDFPGFSAQIAGKADGRAFQGNVTISAAGEVDVQIDDDVVDTWVREQLESVVLHRKAAGGKESKPAVRFADDETDHPLGRLLLFEKGRMASSYRVRDRQLMVVNRHLGKETMTITVLENTKNEEGRFLPRAYTVQFWDAKSGALKRTETVQETWSRLGRWDLPESRTVTTASAAGLSVRSMRLSQHELAKQ